MDAATLADDVAITFAGTSLCTSLTLHGSVARMNDALASLIYVGARNATGRDVVTVSASSVYVHTGRVVEALSDVAVSEFAVTVTPVNDAPEIVVATPSCAVSTQENTPGYLTCLSLTDVDLLYDDTRFVNVTVSVSHGTLLLPLPERYQVSYGAGSPLSSATSLTVGTVPGVSASVRGAATVVFQAPLYRASAAVGYITYTPDKEYFGSDTVTVSINDEGNVGVGGPLSASVTIPVTVAAVNTAPYPIVPKTRVVVDEDASVAVAGVSCGDSDVTSGRTFIEVTLSAGKGVLSLDDTLGLEVVSSGVTAGPGGASTPAEAATAAVGSVAGGAVVVRGPITSVNTALATLVYAPNANDNGRDAIMVVVTEVQRGSAGDVALHGGAVSDFIEVWITAVNDAPTIVQAPSSMTMAVPASVPGGSPRLAFVMQASTSMLELPGVSVGDVDFTPAAIDFFYSVSVSAAHGTLSFVRQSLSSWRVDSPDVAVSINDQVAQSVWQRPDAEYALHFLNVSDGGVTFVASPGVVNQVLGRALAYVPDAGFSGTDTYTIVVNDLGNVGKGGPATTSLSIDIVVAPRNVPSKVVVTEGGSAIDTTSAPLALGAAARVHTDEDVEFAFGVSGDASQSVTVSIVDPDAGTTSLRLTVACAHGSLSMTAPQANVRTLLDGSDGVLVVDGPLGLLNLALQHLQYLPAQDFNGRDWIVFAVEDGRGVGVTTPAYSSNLLAVVLSSLAQAAAGQEAALVSNAPAGSLFVAVDVAAVNDAPTVAATCVDTTTSCVASVAVSSDAVATVTGVVLGDVDVNESNARSPLPCRRQLLEVWPLRVLLLVSKCRPVCHGWRRCHRRCRRRLQYRSIHCCLSRARWRQCNQHCRPAYCSSCPIPLRRRLPRTHNSL